MNEINREVDVRRIIYALALIGMALFSGLYLVGIVLLFLYDPKFLELLYEQLRVFLGVPLAGIAAFCVVLVLEVQTGKIEFEGLGFKFRGASGPVILWIFCFLALAGVINLMWQ